MCAQMAALVRVQACTDTHVYTHGHMHTRVVCEQMQAISKCMIGRGRVVFVFCL